MTACEAVDLTDSPTIHLRGAGESGSYIEGSLPVDIEVDLALCLRLEDAEVQHGALFVLLGAVQGPDGNPAGWRREQVAAEMGDTMPPGFHRRQIMRMPIAFKAVHEGTHTIAVMIEGSGDEPLRVSYAVEVLPTVT